MFSLLFFPYRKEEGHFAESPLVAEALSKAVGHPVTVCRKENGKPYCEGVHFSITHTGNLALLAISDTPIGVDMEQKDRISPVPLWDWVDAEAVAKLMETSPRKVLQKLPPEVAVTRFEKEGLLISMAEYKESV